MNKCQILVSLSLFFSINAIAEVPVDPMLSLCKPYPEIKNSLELPSKFNTTNNLSRSINSAFYQAEGEKIVIYGRLMDVNCVPISDAKIYIWQNNKEGYIQYETKQKHKSKWIDPNFSGTGITNTDNLGRFNFISIMPGSNDNTTPHINIKIEQPQLKAFISKIYFPKDGNPSIKDKLPSNINISQITAVPARIDENGVREYFIDITLNQKIPHREF